MKKIRQCYWIWMVEFCHRRTGKIAHCFRKHCGLM